LSPQPPQLHIHGIELPIAIHDESEYPHPALVFQRRGLESRTQLEAPEGTALVIVG